MQIITTATDNAAFIAAVASAELRARFSHYDQHIITDDEAGYVAIDEGDYGALSETMIERIVHSIPGALNDEY